MKYTSILTLLLAGCAVDDAFLIQNRYLDVNQYPNSNAFYIGEWTGATGPYLTSVKIIANGRARMCASAEYFGQVDGKVFIENGHPKLIFEGGTEYIIGQDNNGNLVLTAYDTPYIYHPGQIPARCGPILGDLQ